jgi:pimeloyl-[acyl-carrier protein] methyl ester esterase
MKKNMVLLHGWGFHSGVWQKDFTRHLETQCHLHYLDLPGFGKSPAPKAKLSLDHIVNYVLDNSPEKATYLGWSLGGLVSMKIAIDYPERIEQLITIASTPKFTATNDWPGMSSETLEKFSVSLEQDYTSTINQFITLQFQGSNTHHANIRALKQLVHNTEKPNKHALKDSLHILKETDLRDQLRRIQCPQLNLLGRCDRLVPVTMTEKLNTLSPNADIRIIPKTSHAPFISQAKTCADLINAFLSS